MATKKEFYDYFFSGMDRRIDADKLADGKSPLCVNVDLDRLGSVRKRKGTSLIGNLGGGGQFVQTIVEYLPNSSSVELHAVRNSNLLIYNDTTKVWDVKIPNAFSQSTLIASVAFGTAKASVYKNRVYYTSKDDFLSWETVGTDLATVGTGTDRIKGNCLAVATNTLFIGNVVVNGVEYYDRVYYSLFDTENNRPNDQFWEDAESGLLESTRYFTVNGGQVQAIVNFRNKLIAFSDRECYSFDVTQVETAPFNALQNIFSVGCAGSRAVTVVDGVMYWIDKQGKIWAWAGNTSRPEEVSYVIDDENLGDSVVSAIDKSESNLSKALAFGLGKRVFFSVGTLSIDNKILNNAVIRVSASQNGLQANFSIDTYPDRLLVACVARFGDGFKILLGNSQNFLLFGDGMNDLNKDGVYVPVNAFYRTKFLNFGAPFNKKSINQLFIRFKPYLIQDSYLTVKIAKNNSVEFVNTINTGVVPISATSSSQKQIDKRINIPPSFNNETSLAFEFSNFELDQTFELTGFGFEMVSIDKADITISKLG